MTWCYDYDYVVCPNDAIARLQSDDSNNLRITVGSLEDQKTLTLSITVTPDWHILNNLADLIGSCFFTSLVNMDIVLDNEESVFSQSQIDALTRSLESIPTLRNIRLSWACVDLAVEGTELQLPWNQLQTIYIDTPHSVAQAAHWLSQSTTATNVTLRGVGDYSDGYTFEHPRYIKPSIYLPKLQYLAMKGIRPLDVLVHLALPSIINLELTLTNCSRLSDNYVEPVKRFLQQPLSKLGSMHIIPCMRSQGSTVNYGRFARAIFSINGIQHIVTNLKLSFLGDNVFRDVLRELQKQTYIYGPDVYPKIYGWSQKSLEKDEIRSSVGWKKNDLNDEDREVLVFTLDNGTLETFVE